MRSERGLSENPSSPCFPFHVELYRCPDVLRDALLGDVGATCGRCGSTIVRRGNGEPSHSWAYNLVDVIEYPDGSASGISFLYFVERWPDVRAGQ